LNKAWRCIKRDGALIKKNLMFWKDKQNPALDKDGRVVNWDNPNAPIFPNYCDVLIIGGGAIGSSIAYWCKHTGKGSLRVVVVEKDPTVRLKIYYLLMNTILLNKFYLLRLHLNYSDF
jgi:hypothetical protein